MKNKILYLCLFSFLLFFCSCDNPNVTNEQNNTFWNTKVGQLDHGIVTKEYKRHSYIFFKEGYRMGVVHNPDCECNKTN